MPSDTYFTQAPEWSWLVILYFFFGGIAGGSYFIAALIDLLGDEGDRPLARLGYFVAFPAVLLCGPLLILDLTRPERFWHMLIQSERGFVPMFKWWSPMSVGAWALLVFGAFTFVSFVGALSEVGVIRWRPVAALNSFLQRRRVRGVFAAVGAAFGFFLASYTGVLLSVTNRPIWADTKLLGLLFLTSAASTAAALLLLLGRRRNVDDGALHWLARLDSWVMIMELVVLALVVISLGSVAEEWLSAWGALLLVGVVLVGILVPLVLHRRPRLLGNFSIAAGAVAALIGGLVLRVVVVLSSEGV
ncbi:MAG: polysulfide reductase NrfD [Chloroflexi bacterium]|nr:polysulfide reductase NrfD [Chloroflexota bacterium]